MTVGDWADDVSPVDVWTDGSLKGNRGGWAWVAGDIQGSGSIMSTDGDPLSSVSVEAHAAIEAIFFWLRRGSMLIRIHSDCLGVVHAINARPVDQSYRDWRLTRLARLAQSSEIVSSKWVKAHSSDPNNHRADSLAKLASLTRSETAVRLLVPILYKSPVAYESVKIPNYNPSDYEMGL